VTVKAFGDAGSGNHQLCIPTRILAVILLEVSTILKQKYNIMLRNNAV
jgi:hypothetical protein